jgi:hypothetical protein
LLGPDLLAMIRRGTAMSPKLADYRAALATLGRLTDSPPGPLAPSDPSTDSNVGTTQTSTTEEITDAR